MYRGDALPAMLTLRPIVCVVSSILASPRSDNANRYPPPSSETIRSETPAAPYYWRLAWHPAVSYGSGGKTCGKIEALKPEPPKASGSSHRSHPACAGRPICGLSRVRRAAAAVYGGSQGTLWHLRRDEMPQLRSGSGARRWRRRFMPSCQQRVGNHRDHPT
jgi:hypothetical protein